MPRTDDMSLILTKSKLMKFFPDVYDDEIDVLDREARKLFGDDAIFGELITNVKNLGADGTKANDTAAFQKAADNGGTIIIPPGQYNPDPITFTKSNTHIIIQPGAVVNHSNTGAVFKITGSQSLTKTFLSQTTSKGSRTVVAPGHEISEGQYFRLSSNKIFDASSTNIKIGEICRAYAVVGDTITTYAPVAGSIYGQADSAYVQKITPIANVKISGGGIISGLKSEAMGQYGIDLYFGRNCTIEEITTSNIDRRHIFVSDSFDCLIRKNTIVWAVDNTQAYGVSMANCAQDNIVTQNTFTNVRHAFTTNNEAAYPGLPRRIVYSFNTVKWTSTALGGSMGGGDAIDTHTAAEDIFIEYNKVLGSAGQGINFECASGTVIGNYIYGTTSYGISIHNEADVAGRIVCSNNTIIKAGNTSVYIRAGSRGTTFAYESIVCQGNISVDSAQSGFIIGWASAVNTGPEEGVVFTGNSSIRSAGSYAFLLTHASKIVHANNTIVGGSQVYSVVDSGAITPTDHDGWLARTIVSDAIAITPTARFVSLNAEGGAATDNIATITGGLRGQIITLRATSNSQDITIVNSGNIRYISAFTLDAARDSMTLFYDGTNWVEMSRGDHPAA